ncbi:HAD family hydrolase [Enterococcus hulanensis]|uniref:HAD family hydrolase n=1 Tax=Enterococcus hulanensis TaxID=2559929 RepID=UPI002892354C|nr:HAD family hydrolase [Enterococcus hulanensis]
MTASKKKMVVFDIDGTLLGSNKKVLFSTLEASTRLKEQGHTLFVATGRSLLYAKPIIQLLGFQNYIVCNGAIGFVDHQQTFGNELAPADLLELLNRFSQEKVDAVIVTLNQLYRVSSFDLEKMRRAMSYVGGALPPVHNQAEALVYQVLAFYDHSLEQAIEPHFSTFDFVRWHDDGVDIIPTGGSKATTILELAGQLGFDREDILSFGDGLNDREMLQTSGIGVAMGNATLTVKKSADMITDTNDDDGIFNALKRLSLI